MRISEKTTRILALTFFATSVSLAVALAGTLRYVYSWEPAEPEPVRASDARPPVSPLLVTYQLDVPGRGEIFPALASGQASEYWPVAVLTLVNSSERPVVQTVSAEVLNWSRRTQQTLVVPAGQTRKVNLTPELLPRAFDNQEIRRATLEVRASGPESAAEYAQTRPVYLHSAYDLYWGRKFANAQWVARWVTPHDPAVLRLISDARRYIARGRMPGYDRSARTPKVQEAMVRAQALAVFRALQRSGLSYVNSVFTFGNYIGQAQRIRLPRETLSLSSANCMDVSVAFAAAMENLGLNPVIVIVPGHAFTGVRLAPNSSQVLYLDLTVLPRGSFEQAIARAQSWLRKVKPQEVLTVDVAAARVLGIYPMPGAVEERVPRQTAASTRYPVPSTQ